MTKCCGKEMIEYCNGVKVCRHCGNTIFPEPAKPKENKQGGN